jgi:hypothetical protein
MYEYECKKCKKKYDHFLPLYHSCNCGGKLKYIYKPALCNHFPSIDINIPLSKEFIPVRLFGGMGDIWYYRRKARKRLLGKKGFNLKDFR